jgi:hypothetical protein
VLVDELIEALTTLGIWLTAAGRAVNGTSPPGREDLTGILTKTTGQYRRAAIAVRCLRAKSWCTQNRSCIEPGAAMATARPAHDGSGTDPGGRGK